MSEKTILTKSMLKRVSAISSKIEGIVEAVQHQDKLAADWQNMLDMEKALSDDVRVATEIAEQKKREWHEVRDLYYADFAIAKELKLLDEQIEYIKKTRKSYKTDMVYSHAMHEREELIAIIDDACAAERNAYVEAFKEIRIAQEALAEYQHKAMSTKEARTARAAYNMMLANA